MLRFCGHTPEYLHSTLLCVIPITLVSVPPHTPNTLKPVYGLLHRWAQQHHIIQVADMVYLYSIYESTCVGTAEPTDEIVNMYKLTEKESSSHSS